MTDKELLELAAKSAGYEFFTAFGSDGPSAIRKDNKDSLWNPLTDDGDALRLAVKLGIYILPHTNARSCADFTRAFAGKDFDERHDESDSLSATRRAIVRAAAEIGRNMNDK